MGEAKAEIETQLEALPGYLQMKPTERNRHRLEFLKNQASLYAAESAEFLSYSCKVSAREMDPDYRCAYDAASFQLAYGLAMKGDYQAQQEIAACFESEVYCSGTVRVHPLLSCAWRLVALASGSQKINANDVEEFEGQCVRKASRTDRTIYRAQADRLFSRVYARSLPSSFYRN
jgi:hypothetical protein